MRRGLPSAGAKTPPASTASGRRAGGTGAADSGGYGAFATSSTLMQLDFPPHRRACEALDAVTPRKFNLTYCARASYLRASLPRRYVYHDPEAHLVVAHVGLL